MKNLVLIIGMGRSGTSMLGKIIKTLGVDFGSKTHGPNKYNPHGYFEDMYIVDINEFIIRNIQGPIKNPQWCTATIPTNWLLVNDWESGWEKKISQVNKVKIKKIIDDGLRHKEWFGIKDPRITLLYPLYEQIAKELNVKLHTIFIKRNPESVANSLENFHKMCVPRNQTIKLCQRYNSDANKYCSNKLDVCYESILRDTELIVRKIASHLNINDENKILQSIATVDNNLNHSK